MKVSTTQFVRSHGRKPRGAGVYAFQFLDSKDVPLVPLFFAGGTVTEATRKAKTYARSLGCVATVEVMP